MSDAAAVVPRIVVGIDGFEPSKAALGWGVWQAELTGHTLVAVIAWDVPRNSTGWPPPGEASFEWEGNAREILAETIDEAIGTDHHVEIRTRVVKGHPAAVLLDEANGAALLGVGTVGTAGSPKPCSAPSDSTSPTRPSAPSSSSAARGPAETDTHCCSSSQPTSSWAQEANRVSRRRREPSQGRNGETVRVWAADTRT